VTLIFAADAVAVPATLLLAGRASDQVGRKPVMAAALGFSALSTVVFILAPSLGWLCYERARTMLLAALHRRRRQRTRARDALFLARDQFALLSAAGWQAHAGRQLERLGLQRSESRELTPSEHRIATLAASGLTNTAVATRLSLSPRRSRPT
jgi:DNA-binding CsgD family transcriptional regulator